MSLSPDTRLSNPSSLSLSLESGLASIKGKAVLELTVNNHAGVMSHICSLFSRRAYNVEGIICMPIGDGQRSRIWLMVEEDQRLEQMLKQVGKLVDVLHVTRHAGNHAVFERLEEFFLE